MKRENIRCPGYKMYVSIRNIKIQHRLMAVFFFISLIPTVCIGLYAYHVYTRSINDKIGESALQTVFSINTNMTIEMKKFQDYCGILSVTDIIQNSLLQSIDGQEVPRDIVTSIRKLSSTIPFQSIYLKNLRIVSLSGQPIYDFGYDDISSEKSAQILESVNNASPRDCLQYIHTYRSQDKLVLGRKLYSADFSGRPVGYIMLYIDERLFQDKIFSNVTFGPSSNIMLVDAHGNVLSSQDRSLLGTRIADTELFQAIQYNCASGKNSFNITEDGKNNLVIAAHNDNFGCYLAATIPESYITEETRSINATLFWMATALVFLSLVSTLVVYISIVSPIRNIIAACNVTSDEDLNIRINDTNQDELGFLARTVDHMVDEIQLLMYRRGEDQIRRRNLELKNLQYQINPHFLFNTLNSLQWVATINDAPTVAEGISSLSTLLRNTIMRTDELIPLSDELENLTNYFAIQKIRYGNSFDASYAIDPKTQMRLLPRFVLQPLAENSIIHGTENMPEAILITVSSILDERNNLIVEICDNGCGFDTLCVNREKEHFSGIGVNNVTERLEIYYGLDGGLMINSEPGKGTVCRLTIPFIPEKEVE